MKKAFIISLALVFCNTMSCSDRIAEDKSIDSLQSTEHAIFNFELAPVDNEEAVAAIIIQGHPQYSEQVICSGTLISPKHILTAAHCVAELSERLALESESSEDPQCKWQASYVSSGASALFPYMKVLFGKHLNSQKRIIYNIKSVTYHSGYKYFAESLSCSGDNYNGYEMNKNDIAIITLEDSVSADVAKPFPILPPWLGISKEALASNISMTFFGFGTSDDGRKGTKHHIALTLDDYCAPDDDNNLEYCPYGQSVHVLGCHPSRSTCRKMGEQDYYDDKVVMPAGAFLYLQKKGGPCSGDSGGPALLYVGKRTYVAGITSFGDSICRTYGVSTAVQDYFDWIVANAPETYDKSLYTEICNNGVDDDGNGLADQADPVCNGQPYCGNGVVDEGELCDNNKFWDDREECSDWSLAYESGKIKCNDKCIVDYSNCVEYAKPSTCGNGQIDDDEQCDGDILLDMYKQPMMTASCQEFSSYLHSGTISCNSNCTINIENCIASEATNAPKCGDGIVEGNEICDGTAFAEGVPDDCSEWDSRYSSGKIKCTNTCMLTAYLCTGTEYCGDGFAVGNEYCDGSSFFMDDNSCASWSTHYSSGTIKCTQNCMPDYSTCTLNTQAASLCGNGKLDSYQDPVTGYDIIEECDGTLFSQSDECSQLESRFSSGKVVCTSNCSIDFGKCILSTEENELNSLDESSKNTLGSAQKPEITVNSKTDDAITFESNASNLQESLIFEDLNGNIIDEPPVPTDSPTESGSDTPNTAHSSNDSDGSDCQLTSRRHTQTQNWPVLLLLFFGLGLFRIRKVQ